MPSLRLVLPARSAYLVAGQVTVRVATDARGAALRGSEVSLAPGDVIVSRDTRALRLFAAMTDDGGAPLFEVASGDGVDYDAIVVAV